ncbi:F-box domain protein [Aspergillus undulatus]|uniref:F-box domain protein n=1 Tax=Aspergillus undulatus TaxID=1810928 RepID=UPI003CCD1C1A
MASPIESLPTELLDEIIACLSSSPPSSNRLHQNPSAQLTRSRNRDLKNLSLTCSRLLELVQPPLFSHSCFELNDLDAYLSFISESQLSRYVTSVVVKGDYNLNKHESSGPPWWRHLFCSLTPRQLIVVAPPSVIGEIFGMHIPKEHAWAFEIPLQVVHLECDWRKCRPSLTSDEQSNLLDSLPWSSMLFNESSSLKAYNHYEYFLYQVPSLIHRWGPWAVNQLDQPVSARPPPLPSLANLTSFTYVAVFPFYNHVQQVLEAVELMTNLRTLKIQLGPSQNNRVTELEQRGSMDPSDPWMELATGYSLIAHAVRNLERKGCLSTFIACDYEMEAVRAEIDVILGDILCDGPWSHDGHGIWTKKPVIDGVEGHGMAAVDSLESLDA